MDVLEYWHPRVGWAGFRQGTVSERMWGYFCQLVQLCHAHGHCRKLRKKYASHRLVPRSTGLKASTSATSAATSGSAISSARKGTCIVPRSWPLRR